MGSTVPGDDEDPEPLVRGADVGRANTCPRRVIPEIGKVPENTSKCSESRSLGPVLSQQSLLEFHIARGIGRIGSTNVLPNHVARSDDRDGFSHLHPEVRAGALGHALAAPSRTEVLAGCSASDDVDRFHKRPVDLRQVTEVRNTGPVRIKHLRRCFLELAEPPRFGIKKGLNRKVKSSVAAA
ncbi:hypothetical protein GCM10022287_22350 [Gryllotalpicola koreensis]|uniref:Uncharacterized protein n=1 Tax=Gryllotalpicola koreensis TaxID=993086 RepID=A0ABP8A225_9MICO